MKALKGYISHGFIQEFLSLFDSEEPREREYLKNILHRLYAKVDFLSFCKELRWICM